mgnify:CR=1 FL=1
MRYLTLSLLVEVALVVAEAAAVAALEVLENQMVNLVDVILPLL